MSETTTSSSPHRPTTHVPVGDNIDEITPLSLQKLHAEYLSIYGPSTKEQQSAIIDALGGFETLFTALLESQSELITANKTLLHKIISNPNKYRIKSKQNDKISKQKQTKNAEDKAHNEHQSITYTFCDEDMFLHKLFDKPTAIRLSRLTFSRAINVGIILYFLLTYFVSSMFFVKIPLDIIYLIQTSSV